MSQISRRNLFYAACAMSALAGAPVAPSVPGTAQDTSPARGGGHRLANALASKDP